MNNHGARIHGKGWQARWRDADGIERGKGGFLTKKAAVQYKQEQELAVREGRAISPRDAKTTVRKYLIDVHIPALSATKQTKENYLMVFDAHILPTFGHRAMSSIRPEEIERWMEDLRKGRTGRAPLADTTVQKSANIFAALFKRAKQNRYITESPFAGVKRKKAKRTKAVLPLTTEQAAALVEAMPDRFQLLVRLGCYTGCRPSELLGLTVDRIGFTRNKIKIDRQVSRDPKTIFADGLKTERSHRTITMPPTLKRHIEEHIAKYGVGPEGLLLSNRSGRVWRYHAAQAVFRKAAAEVGLPQGTGIHVLRHTFVSAAIDRGINVAAISKWVGHENLSETLDTYAHLFPDSTDTVAEAMNAAFDIAGGTEGNPTFRVA